MSIKMEYVPFLREIKSFDLATRQRVAGGGSLTGRARKARLEQTPTAAAAADSLQLPGLRSDLIFSKFELN